MVEPVNRDRPPARLGRLRSRIAISTRMPTDAEHADALGDQAEDRPVADDRQLAVGVTTSKYASSTSSDSTMKPTITNQCAAPTTLHLSIRVWPAVSTSIVLVAGALVGEPLRVGLARAG